MADFFGDLFGAFTGQAPEKTYNPLTPQQGYGQAYDILQGLVPQYSSLNQSLQPVLTGLQLSNENQIYGPQANALRQGTYQSILDQLNLGEALSPELQADITRKLFESNAATGFGASTAGRGNVILQTGLEGERRGQQRRQEALQATNLLPASRYQYKPTSFPEVSNIYGDLQDQNAIQNNLDNQNEMIRQQNFSNLLNTGTRLLGAGIGGAVGGPFGAMAGSQIGGSIFPGPGGTDRAQAGQQGGINSILQGLYFDQFMNQKTNSPVATPNFNPVGGGMFFNK